MASVLIRGAPIASSLLRRNTVKILSGCIQERSLNVQEHVSYTILNQGGIATPKFGVAKTEKEAREIAKKLDTNNLVLKAQVLAGGRGKGTFKNGFKSGVRMVHSPEEAEKISKMMLNQVLVTKQTGAGGRMCTKVMVGERKFPRREFYFSVMLERAFGGPVIIASSQGGVNIEEVAAEDPKAIIYQPISIIDGLSKECACYIAERVGMGDKSEETADMLMNMWDIFVKKDAILVEINPYAEDVCEQFYALDAKFRFDDNAHFRQKELFAMRDTTQEDPKEVAAAKFELNYIALDGEIGCMVNGAGLAMATMDIIKLYGGSPANFLDIGGSATPEAVKEAFKIITLDPKCLCIMVNIFGGIIRCNIVAEGIIAAAKELKLEAPIVVRLQGQMVKEAKELIQKSQLRILVRDDLTEAADLAVHLSKIVLLAKEVNLSISFKSTDKKKKK